MEILEISGKLGEVIEPFILKSNGRLQKDVENWGKKEINLIFGWSLLYDTSTDGKNSYTTCPYNGFKSNGCIYLRHYEREGSFLVMSSLDKNNLETYNFEEALSRIRELLCKI